MTQQQATNEVTESDADCCESDGSDDNDSANAELHSADPAESSSAITDAEVTAFMSWAAAITNCYMSDRLQSRLRDAKLRLLRSAIKSGNFSAAEAIIKDKGSEGVRLPGETDLMLAIQPGATAEFVGKFVIADCDANSRDAQGRTALSLAAQHGLASVVRFLCAEAGADPAIGDERGRRPVDFALASLETCEDGMRGEFSDIIDWLS